MAASDSEATLGVVRDKALRFVCKLLPAKNSLGFECKVSFKQALGPMGKASLIDDLKKIWDDIYAMIQKEGPDFAKASAKNAGKLTGNLTSKHIDSLNSREAAALNAIIAKYRLKASIEGCNHEGEALARILIALAGSDCTFDQRRQAFNEVIKVLSQDRDTFVG